MARPTKPVLISLDDALAELKRNPANTVHARVEGLDVELRVIAATPVPEMRLGDWMASAGPWQGETEAEVLAFLRDARRAGGSAEPPAMP